MRYTLVLLPFAADRRYSVAGARYRSVVLQNILGWHHHSHSGLEGVSTQEGFGTARYRRHWGLGFGYGNMVAVLGHLCTGQVRDRRELRLLAIRYHDKG